MKPAIAVVIAVAALLAACGGDDKASYEDDLTLICRAPIELDADRFPANERLTRIRAWLEKKVTHARARQHLPGIAELDLDTRTALGAAAEEHGLDECPLLLEDPPETELAPQRIPSATGAALSSDLPFIRVVVDAAAIRLGDRAVVRLDDWRLPDGAIGDEGIEALRKALRTNAVKVGAVHRLGVLLDRDTPFALASAVMLTARRLGMAEQLMIVSGDDGLGAIPIYFPDTERTQATDAGPGGDDDDAGDGGAAGAVRLVVTVTGEGLSLWSASGEEGTMADPKVTLEPASDAPTFDLAPLSVALQEIVQRRWPDPDDRGADDDKIALLFADRIPAQTVVDVVVAVRAGPDGDALFPMPLLGSAP